MTRKPVLYLVSLVVACAAAAARGDDWPTYLHDAGRSAVSAESPSAPLSAQWTFAPTHPPVPAWGDPQPKPVEQILELPRMRFDDAYHVAAVGDAVYFGSSADGQVYALDAATGEVRWRFPTEGPVRMAPTVAGGKVYAGSDDGHVYCLGAADGRLLWKFAAAPSPERVLGNGQMISVWPVRTGVLVDGGVAYFGAGVFPAEGLYLYAVGAEDGKPLWSNDTYARGGLAGISPQGYLVASAGRLFVPSGRAMPAAFSRDDGRFLFHRNFNWRATGLFGGASCTLAGDLLLNGVEQLAAVREKDGQLVFNEGLPATRASEGVRHVVATADTVYLLTGQEAAALDRATWVPHRTEVTRLTLRIVDLGNRRDALRRDHPKPDAAVQGQIDALAKQIQDATAERKKVEALPDNWTRWRVACTSGESLMLAGDLLFAGGDGAVAALKTADGKQAWTGKVTGRARGLAMAGGRLLVSTDTGHIHCFVQGKGGQGRKVSPKVVADPLPADDLTASCRKAAEHVAKASGVKRGYGLVLGGGAGRLALELAKRTDLRVIVAEPDEAKAAEARQALTAAGLYGARVTVSHAPGALPYADYFANLIVCDADFFARENPAAPEDVLRLLKPCGGVAMLADVAGGGAAERAKAWRAAFLAGLGRAGEVKTQAAADWLTVSRGPLHGAGGWTHQYGEPGNTCSSDDEVVRGPIGILWFGEPGPGRMSNRHSSAASPLAIGGRMFIQGENVVMAYDAYNGLPLWEEEIRGAQRLNLKTSVSNLAANQDSLFVAVGDRCLRLDAATGKTLKTYKTPAPKDEKRTSWVYLATVGDLVYGSVGPTRVFALEVESGKVRWTYDGKDIQPATICIGSGHVFLVDRTVTEAQQEEALKEVTPEMRVDAEGRPIQADVRLVVALDAETGRTVWTRPQYVADCVKISMAGGDLTAMTAHDVLLLCGQPWNGHFWKEFFAGKFSRRSLIALAARDGKPLWSARKGYRSRPLIVGDRIIAEPWAHDLYTGAEQQREHPVTGTEAAWQMSRPGHHCGNIAASPHALFFRSGSTATYDLDDDYGTAHFGAQRPGCWVNCIPANGVVMMPEASSGCVCAFALHTTIVFAPRPVSRVWGMFSAPGPVTPVKRLAVNFGAPGDRKDSRGTLWLAYPRPQTDRLVLDLKLDTQMLKGGEFQAGNADFLALEGTADSWIYASGARGMASCSVPVADRGAAPARFTVRLHFCETGDGGAAAIDVRLQDRPVLEQFEVVREAGGRNRALVKEFKGVEASDRLTVSVSPREKDAPAEAAPLLCGLEIVRE